MFVRQGEISSIPASIQQYALSENILYSYITAAHSV
jgi:hypothetical protein